MKLSKIFHQRNLIFLLGQAEFNNYTRNSCNIVLHHCSDRKNLSLKETIPCGTESKVARYK